MVKRRRVKEEDQKQKPQIEVCLNPFRKRKCGNPDIVLYIQFKGEKLPICRKCAEKIADSDLEWSSDGKK